MEPSSNGNGGQRRSPTRLPPRGPGGAAWDSRSGSKMRGAWDKEEAGAPRGPRQRDKRKHDARPRREDQLTQRPRTRLPDTRVRTPRPRPVREATPVRCGRPRPMREATPRAGGHAPGAEARSPQCLPPYCIKRQQANKQTFSPAHRTARRAGQAARPAR